MTRINIDLKLKNIELTEHEVGNFYKHINGDIYFLVDIEDRAVLINLVGGFSYWSPMMWSHSTPNLCLNAEDFDTMTNGTSFKFSIMNNIRIKEE